MIRLDGHNILIVETDPAFAAQLAEVLSHHGANCVKAEHISESKLIMKDKEFDLVISNYYLDDGVIHQLIDWSTRNLEFVPVFTCVGYPYVSEIEISHRSSISEIFTKYDFNRIVTSLSRLLFDFDEFEERLLESVTPVEIMLELHIDEVCYLVRPSEITSDSVIFDIDTHLPLGISGVLKFSLLSFGCDQNFLIPGVLESSFANDEKLFRVDTKHLKSWEKFCSFLNLKQLNVSNFIKRVSGN